jgi:hypothetical protein
MGKHVAELIVKECKASEFKDCDIVFSGLDADVAGDIGENSSFGRHFKEGLADQAVLQRWNSSRLNWQSFQTRRTAGEIPSFPSLCHQ